MFVPQLPQASGTQSSGDAVAHKTGAPVMCTEFGGVNIAAAKDGDDKKKKDDDGAAEDWGYTTAKDASDLLARFEKLIGAVTEGGYCCAFVYTQL